MTTKLSKAQETKVKLLLVTGCNINKIAELFNVPVRTIESLDI